MDAHPLAEHASRHWWGAWLTIPFAFVAAVALDAADLRQRWGTPGLIAGLNFTFLTLGSWLIALVAARSFRRHGTPGLLLLGAGALAFGTVAPFSVLAAGGHPDVGIVVYDMGTFLAGACHLAAVVSLLGWRRPVRSRALLLALVYAAAIAGVLAISVLARAGAFPPFFVQGHGGTVSRQLVLGLAVACFASAAWLLATPTRRSASPFQHWYATGLGVVATGLLAILLQKSFSSPLGWLGRATQYLGGAFMLIAALRTTRQGARTPLSLDAVLREAQERHRALFEHMKEGVFLAEVISDAAGKPVDYRYLDVNPAFERLTGLRRRAVVGRTFREVFPAAEDAWIEAYGQVALTGVPTRLDGFAAPLGRHYETSAYSPAPGQFACVFTDVSERKRAEAELRENEACFRAMFEHATDAIILVDPDGGGRILSANPSACRLFGYSAEEFTGLEGKAILDAADLRADDLKPAGNAAGASAGERTYVRRDGSRFVGESTSALFEAGPGRRRAVAIIRDVTEREHGARALRESQARLRHYAELVEHAPVLVRDGDDRIVVWSRGMELLYGFPREAALGRISHELLRTRSPVPLAEIRSQLERTGAWRGEVRHHRADGLEMVVASRWFEHVDAGGTRQVVEVHGDVTALRQAEQALREADRRKDEFLGMLSHELRNPLAPIRNSAYILRHAPPGSENARRAGEVIERQAEHLTRLVDDLLDVTRIARGKIEIRRSRVDLREVVLRAVEDYRLPLEGRGVAFRAEVPERNVWADVDVTRVTQVVGNLLHNALKFTRRGDEVALTLAVADGQAEVRVKDTGAGIEPGVLTRVFEPFVQGEHTLARTEGGLGLGLALVRGIAELHGGTVAAASAGRGRGAEFVVRLPVVSPERAQRESPGGAERQTGGLRVLVVDDDADTAASMVDLLLLQGHLAEVAYDGPSALAKLSACPPDVVLCDVGLPGMSGYEVARTVRAAANEAIRLIALTGYAQPEDVQRASEAGFHAHLAKPLDPDELGRVLAAPEAAAAQA